MTVSVSNIQMIQPDGEQYVYRFDSVRYIDQTAFSELMRRMEVDGSFRDVSFLALNMTLQLTLGMELKRSTIDAMAQVVFEMVWHLAPTPRLGPPEFYGPGGTRLPPPSD